MGILIKFLVQLVGRSGDFAGFFIQARAENNQDSVSSVVGTWTPMNNEARTVQCNDHDGVSELASTFNCLYKQYLS